MLKPPTSEQFDEGVEQVLQNQVCDWLANRGYHRRSQSAIALVANVPKPTHARWQFHMRIAKGNWILGDVLLMWPAMGAYLELELKKKGGGPSTEQKVLEKAGAIDVCWNLSQVKEAVIAWELRVEREAASGN